MLLEISEPTQALGQFEAMLKKEPGRFRALYGAAHAAQLSGSREASEKYFRELIVVAGRGNPDGRAEMMEARKVVSRN
jgi:hypothetical protein